MEKNNDLADLEHVADILELSKNPFAENLLKKAPSTISRHLRELRNFGAFLDHQDAAEESNEDAADVFTYGEFELFPAARTGSKCSTARLMQRAEDWKDVTAADIHDYKNYLLYHRGLAISTVNQILFIIRSYAGLSASADGMSAEEYFKATQQVKGIRAREGERIDALRPVSRVSSKKEQAVILSRYDAERLKHEQPDDPRGRRDAFLMCLLLDYGLRISDAIGLTTDNINMERHIVSVKTQKTGTNLYLSMTDDIYAAAVRYFEGYTPEPGAPIWYGVNKWGQIQGNFSKHSAQMRITELGAAIGLQHFSAHDCRHYWVTAADRGGSSLLAITEAGGWTSPTMPARYINKSKISNQNIKLG